MDFGASQQCVLFGWNVFNKEIFELFNQSYFSKLIWSIYYEQKFMVFVATRFYMTGNVFNLKTCPTLGVFYNNKKCLGQKVT